MQRMVAILVAVLAALLAGWWFFLFYSQQSEAPAPDVVQTDTEISADPESQWQWQFESAGEDVSGAPKTKVTLQNGVTGYQVGTYLGSCVDIKASSWKIAEDEGELAGAICWWAGGGNEIGVFSEEGKAVVKVGVLDEGSAETPAFRGDFVTLFEITFGFIRSATTGTTAQIAFDDALWLSGSAGEDAAIQAGLCTEATRAECLPNDFFIYNETEKSTSLPLDPSAVIYMLTWHAEEQGVKRENIRLFDFAKLVNDPNQHWNKLSYNVTIQDGRIIMIEEVYIP